MIFVTVGAQMPFDRLVRTVDQWAAETERDDVFAQIGESSYRPHRIDFRRFILPEQFERCFRQADVIVSHAGAGSVLTALRVQRPILVMPRLGRLNETRNDHQVAMAGRFEQLGYVTVAGDEIELRRKLHHIDDLATGQRIGDAADPRLLDTIRRFIEESPPQPPR